MSNKKKIFSILLVLVMIVSVLTACSSNTTSGTTGSTTAPGATTTQGEPAELVVAFLSGSNLTDLDKVTAAINDITQPKINATITLKQFSWANFTDQFNLILASSSEKLDLMPVFSNLYTNYISSGKLLDLTDSMNEYGQGIVEAVGENYIVAGQIDGRQFGIPAIMGWPSSTAIVMRKDILDTVGVDLKTVKKLSDLTPIFAKILAADPGMVPLVPNAASMLSAYVTYDSLNDGFGVLMGYGQSTEVVNWYESQEYADLLTQVREWNQAGYIMADSEITTDFGSVLVKNGAGYGFLRSGSPGAAESETMATGYEMVQVNISDALNTTAAVTTVQWCSPVNCKDTDSAIKMLNLMYTDETVANLIAWGIEGEHYIKKADGTIGYSEGLTADTSPYMPNTAWEMGNQFITYVWEGNAADYNEQLQKFNKSAKASKAMGFMYDSSSVANAITAVSNVCDQYRPALECGAVDPAVVLPEFIQALKDAGIDQIIAEKQSQLNAWIAG